MAKGKDQAPLADEPSGGKFQQSRKEREFSVSFRQNRSYELYVGRTVVEFGPNGRQVLPESIIEHPDFKQVSGMFSVQEVR